jgi:hypothetical protein
MNAIMHIAREDTNAEVLARIVKAASHKYDCSMEIDYSSDNRISRFVGDDALKMHIAEEVSNIFSRKIG